MSVEIITGPPVEGPQGMSKEAAEQALLRNAEFPKGADYKLQALAGRWIAAVSTPDFQKAADFPPSDDGGGSPDGPPSNGGPDDSSGDGPPSDDGDSGGDSGSSPDGGDAPPEHDHHDKGDKGGSGLHELEAKVDLLLSALGIDPSGMGGDPMGGGGPAAPGLGGPPPGPPGMGAPPHGHGGPPGAGGPDTTIHERAMKPGETPPGGTPLGAPAFASVKVDPHHPWAHMIGKDGKPVQAAFTVREHLGTNEDIVKVHDELQHIARSGGFRIARFDPFFDENGGRNVEAVIQAPQPAQQ